MNANHLRKSAFNFLEAIYEDCVDRGLNLVEIQLQLRDKGINKPIIAIKHDLDNVYQFHRYAVTHLAPPMMSYAEVDALLAKGKLQSSYTSIR